MLSRSLPRRSNLKALFPPRPRDGWHQSGEIPALGSAYGLDAELTAATDAIDPAGALVGGIAQEREEPAAA
jgi:hypothetical protein